MPHPHQIILPPYITSIHGMVCRKTRLVFYTRNNKVFWKIMPYINHPATISQRYCRNAFAEAQRLSAQALKNNPHKQAYWQQIAATKGLKSARHAAFKYFYSKAKCEIAKQIKSTANKLKKISNKQSLSHSYTINIPSYLLNSIQSNNKNTKIITFKPPETKLLNLYSA